MAFTGIAKVQRKEEWRGWVPTADIKNRLGNIPDHVAPGPHNPLGARGLYLSPATRTLFIASTAPISRNTSARRSPPAASG
jgi:lipoprotein-anchoring transpeptidase ErfK/SrfK